MLGPAPAVAGWVVETAGPPPEEGTSASLRVAVTPAGLRVADGDAVIAELWPRRELPVRADAPERLGVAFPGLSEGALVGLLRLPSPWTDYRGATVAAGVFALRYALQPADGAHTGLSSYRDFLLLVPADGDAAAEPRGDDLLALSRSVGDTAHPAVLGLFPVYQEVEAPRVVENEMGQPTVAVPMGGVVLGLVVRGHAEAEGY